MKKSAWLVSVVLLIFGLIYASISLVNHYYFRTYAFDLGIFNQAAYHYSTFQWNANTVRIIQVDNLLSDHMSLILIPLSFTRYLFGTYSLLIVQILFVLFGGFGCYKLIREWYSSTSIALLGMVHFFSFIGLIAAFGFDYHNNVIGASFIPWFYYYLKKNKLVLSAGIALLIIICKENFALLVAAIAIGHLFIEKESTSQQKWVVGGIALFGIFYFILVMKLIMPAIANEGNSYEHFLYSILGADSSEAIKNLIQNPLIYLKYLFTNHTSDQFYNHTKSHFWLIFLLSGGVFSLINPKYLPAAFFILMQKMLNDDPAKWGLSAQYSVALTPLVTLSLFEALRKVKKRPLQITFSALIVLSTILSSLHTIEYDLMGWTDKNNLMFYKKERYESNLDLKAMHKTLQEIPADAAVSAESRLVAHLAFRDEIYFYPVIDDAKYIVLLHSDEQTYPLSTEDYTQKVKDLMDSPDWKVEHKSKDLLIFKRINQ